MTCLPRLLAILAFIARPLSSAHPSLPGPAVPDGLGVNIHFTDPAEGEMELLAGAGFRWVRMDLGWGNIERERGVYDFSAFDHLTAQLQKHRIKALFILDYSNRLFETDSSVRTAEGRSAFARWAAAAAKRYQGRGFLWEVWNEPNITFWKPEPDVGDYSALARAAAKAIHEAAPGEAVIGPATSGFDFPFLEACFNEGVLDEWDAVSVHPYRQNGPETSIGEYAKLRQSIRRFAPDGRDIPIISGEWGYSAAWKNFDEDLQGRMLAREFLTNLSQGIPLSIWYDWRDDGPDPNEPEHHFGSVGLLRKVDGKNVFRIKPAWRAARALTTTLAGHHFIRRLAIGAGDDRVLLFGNDRDLVVACWTTSGDSHKVKLPVGGAKCRIRNHLGDEDPPAMGDPVEVTLDAAPRYILLDRKTDELMAIPAPPDFRCEIVKAPGGVLLGSIENPDGEPFEGSMRQIGNSAGPRVPFSLVRGETAKVVRLDDRDASATGIEIWKDEHRILLQPARRILLVEPGLFGRCVMRGDGDPKVASTQTIAAAENAPPLPGFSGPVWEINCRFEPGWRFSSCEPQGDPPVHDAPKSFGLWVFGDSSGVGLRLRVRDANERTWQLDGGNVTWRGWRHVRFTFGPDTANWGGKGEAVVRYPLQWEAPLLIDNLSRQLLGTHLFVSSPTTTE